MDAAQPRDARSLFYLALEKQESGRLDDAERLYYQALSLDPDRASILINLSAVLIQRRKYKEAIGCIDKALELDAGDADAWLNKAFCLQQQRDYPGALACVDRALAIGNRSEAHYRRGQLLKALDRNEEALASFDRALELDPRSAEALRYRGHVLHRLARREEAIASYRASLENGGNPDELNFYLAALNAGSAPAISPPQLMTGLFDDYADHFDQHQAVMQYCVPRAAFDAVAATASAGGWDIGDLGCGTGLCGPLFRPLARTLTGVDLSPKMIEKARERGVYDALVQDDISGFLRARPDAFDLLIAADVFIYIGDLDPVFRAAREALRDGGHFVFSLETHEGPGYVVRSTRRYAQSLPYLHECAARNGFVVTGVTPLVVRNEYGRNVDGVIAVMRPGGG